jgi:hypothetical protein
MNLRRTRRLFPARKIVLISNQKQLLPRGVSIFLYNPGAIWNQIEVSLAHPKDYRNNFWMTSMARFLALVEYQEVIGKEMIHIESDVILSRDFPFEKFHNLRKSISFPIISDERGVASVLYLKDSKASVGLLETLMEELQRDVFTSDMLILGRHFLAEKSVCPLPIGPGGALYYRKFTPQGIQNNWDKTRDEFGGVFDGADVGIYFFGTDPRNSRGRSFLQREIPTEYGNAKQWKLDYSKSRDFIDFIVDESKIPLYCLHVTSKQLSMFRIKLPRDLIKKRIRHSGIETTAIFFRVGFIQAAKAFRRRTRKFLR